MAYCESCNSSGHDPRTLIVAKKEDKHILVGPCCLVPSQEPRQTDPTKLNYGLELSSHYGLLAYAEFAGVKMEYRKTPEQVAQILNNNRLR